MMFKDELSKLDSVKIGYTSNIENRINNIRKIVEDVEIITTYKSNNSWHIEQHLHKTFKEYNKNNYSKNIPGYTEWYSKEALEDILTELKAIDEH